MLLVKIKARQLETLLGMARAFAYWWGVKPPIIDEVQKSLNEQKLAEEMEIKS